FPPAMKRKAMATKVGGMAGKLAAGIMGKMLGGQAEEALDNVGKVGELAAKSGELGRPPRNRIVLNATLRKQRCKVLFDLNGADTTEMSAQAKVLYKQIEKARKKAEVEPIVEVEGDTAEVNVVVE